MKAFITGASGFLGGRLARKLVERGYDVHALVRTPNPALSELGVTPVTGDILDHESMREGMRGSDVVFHVAGWYKIGGKDWRDAERINVEGTRNVLELAHELGVPKIVYTSTVAVFGDTHGKLVDETAPMPGEPFPNEYDRTKWKAHVEVALPLIERGAPVIIVMPGGIYGPGDHSQLGEMMRMFYKGQTSIFPSPELALTFAHVDDIAEGHILAAEKGRVGETYILAGPAYSMRDMVKIWAGVTGRPAPVLYLPAAVIKPFGPLVSAVGSRVPLPPVVSRDSINLLDMTYTASAAKAQRELGWQPRPLEEGLRETFDWIAQTTPAASPETLRQQQKAGLALAAAAALFTFWLARRRRN